ncbi:MAG TPA: AlkA N-terminal domain-containing protein [Bryobacteraceae bacterium]|nr:AlkA N-terminal domain-containing protein [Bryobacteraceae bacterium]
MALDPETCRRARLARDRRFDGCFFIAVRTTNIYCRPICPAPSPKEENITYFPSAAGAAEAGYRPCLRCRPEASPGTPAWVGTCTTVSRALRLIAESALDDSGVDTLADKLGVGSRHLRRLFVEHLGAPPVAVAQTRRLHFAKKLIDETELSFTDIAMASGFGSVRRFNTVFQNLYGRTPTELRRLIRTRPDTDKGSYRFRLLYRPPFDWEAILGFLQARAIPGVESVADGAYRRSIDLGGVPGRIEVRHANDALQLRIEFPDPKALFLIVERVRRIFDLAADPFPIEQQLRADPLLAARLERRPGLRVPGAWDEFELSVRAVLGQQISVKAASTLAGRIAQRFGSPFGDDVVFPTREALANAPIEECGVIGKRAETIRALARADRAGPIPGIGPWTTEYIAMRASGNPDAFPAGDLILQRAASCKTARELENRAETWRPWRAYAAIHLWQGVKDDSGIH